MRSNFSGKFSLALILVLLILIVLRFSGILSPIESLFFKVLNPVGSFVYGLEQKVRNIWKEDISQEEYDNLKKENQQLIVENIKLRTLEEENSRLKEILDFTNSSQYKFLTAGIMGRDPLRQNYFILNRGSDDGVQNGLSVISPEGILVGKIIKTDKRISTMILPTDTSFQTAGAIFTKSGEKTVGIITGERGLGIKMEFIRQGEDIDKDDIVATSGLEFNMPKGLVVGKIAEVNREDKVVFGTAVISPPLSYENLSVVMIILPEL
jgi:rod shape-determining protein MreC